MSLDGGVMGEGGCPSRDEVLAGNLRLSPNNVLTVVQYRRRASESQENTLTNWIILLLSKMKFLSMLILEELALTLVQPL
jgi:hypothetical protein